MTVSDVTVHLYMQTQIIYISFTSTILEIYLAFCYYFDQRIEEINVLIIHFNSIRTSHEIN